MENKVLKPKIRFKGFTGTWEQRKLNEVISEYKETVDSGCDLPILTSSKSEGVVLQEEHFGRIQNHDITGYNILPLNYCTYRNRSDGVDFTFNINKRCNKGIISKFYPVFTGKNSDIFFISLELNHSKEIIHEISYTCTGTGQKVLSFLDLQKMNIKIPSYNEQHKIGQLFEKIDNLITLHQSKYDKLVNVKKALLEKMFPKDGKNVPEIRFKGFTDTWEQRKLEGIYKFQYGEFNNNPSNGGIYPVYGANGIIGGYTNYNAENSVIIGHMGEYAGSVLWGNGKHFVTYNGTISKPRGENVVSKFGYYMLYQKDINKICGGSGLPFLSYEQLNKIEVCYPKDIKEQKSIANYLTNIDNLITLHQHKCFLKFDNNINIELLGNSVNLMMYILSRKECRLK